MKPFMLASLGLGAYLLRSMKVAECSPEINKEAHYMTEAEVDKHMIRRSFLIESTCCEL